MYNSSLVIDTDVDSLEKLLRVEDSNLGRSSFSFFRKDNSLFIEMKADDAVALKTVMNTLSKVLIVWEKTKVLK